jgi:hypothetical protein
MRTKTCMAVLIGCLAATGEAAAQNYCELERIHYRAAGDGVTADFTSVDTTTCASGIETTVHVDASLGDIHIADVCGHGSTSVTDTTDSVSNIVSVVIGVYDRCLGTSVRSITGTGVADELHVNPSRKAASLRAALTGTDESDQSVSLAIDLVWDGVGRKELSRDHVTLNAGIFRLVFSSSGLIRSAVAAGSVVLDGTDVTPLRSTRGTIEKDATRELDVYR